MWGDMRGNLLDTQRIKVGKPQGKHPEKRLTAVAVRSTLAAVTAFVVAAIAGFPSARRAARVQPVDAIRA